MLEKLVDQEKVDEEGEEEKGQGGSVEVVVS